MLRLVVIAYSFLLFSCASQQKLRKADLKKDVVLETNYGNLRVRLSDETPQHRDNFLKLAKGKYYDGVLFHRVINKFMIQAGDPDSRKAATGQALGEGSPGYTIPAEFRTHLFHKKGVIAAAREGDDVNPQKASSGSQFYIVQGKVWTDGGLDTLEIKRLNGRKIPLEQRAAYKTIGGTPHLDQNYTVFGEVIEGLSVIDTIAAVATSKGKDKDRPLKDVVIKKARLAKRKS